MSRNRAAVRSLAWSLAMLLPLAACNRGPSKEVQQELTTLRTQRDSLIRDAATKTQEMQRLSHAIEAIQGTDHGGGALPPESLRDHIAALATSLDQTRSELKRSGRRIRVLARRASILGDSLQSTRALSDSLLSMERDSLAALHQSLTMTADSLGQRISAVSDTLRGLQKDHYTVYYDVGSEQQLLTDGIVTKEGGARFLGFLWKRGQALVPARSLGTAAFKTLDLRDSTTIPLPAQGTYRLVSRQDVQYLKPAPDADGRFTGDHLDITNPQAFWQQSRFLILMRVQ